MRKKQIDLFFRELDKALGRRGDIILLGAGAGTLMGHIRPSLDIDFEIRFLRSRRVKGALDEIILQTAKKTGVAVNFSENVGHWSMVSYLDYRKTALDYKTFGRLTVKIMAPDYWTIGKITRYYALDARDAAAIIRKKKLSPERLVRLWKRALDASDLSPEIGLFKRHAVHFLKTYGKKLWGKSFRYEKMALIFERARP